MLTRCPSCDTTFRVTPEQIKARVGRVRCGACQQVFNALDTLIEEAAGLAPAMPLVPPQTPEPPAADHEVIADAASPAPSFEVDADLLRETAVTETDPPELAPPDNDSDATAESAPPASNTAEAPEATTTPEAENSPEATITPPEAPSDETISVPDRLDLSNTNSLPPAEPPSQATDEPPPAEQTEPPAEPPQALPPLSMPDAPPTVRRWPWLIGLVLSVLALAVQFALHFRTELAIVEPAARPILETLCDFAGCRVELPSKADLLTIEASDLAPDSERKGVLNLSATLRNQAPFAQSYPALELTLTDNRNETVIRRILLPADYLPRGKDAEAGLAAHGELPLHLVLDAGAVSASGYRLYLFYP